MRLLSVLLLALVACDTRVAGGKADGPAVFAEACARCHGEKGTPSESMKAQLGVRDLRSAEFRGRATLELVEHQVRTGSPNKIMPSFAETLSAEQIRAVSEFVLSLK